MQDVAPFVQKVFEDRELFVLPPGQSEEDIARLLNDDRLNATMTRLKQEFDLIVLDIPSMLGLADATLFSRNTDALVLVASLHKTKLGALDETVDELEKKQIPVLGLVVNCQKGAVPVLRATIGQSSSMNYFPDIDETAPENRSLIVADVEENQKKFGRRNGNGHQANGETNGQSLKPPTSEDEKEESII
jgi:MinD-like ATPase involved in chromosome partitioning or flagellar assembly